MNLTPSSKPKKHWSFRIADMMGAIDYILRKTTHVTLEQFMANEDVWRAVLREFTVLGEAATHVPNDVREKYSAVEWRKIIGMRHVLAHDYENPSGQIILETAQLKLQPLLTQLQKIWEENNQP